MAGQRQPIALVKAKGKKHLTKAEIEEREKTELKVDLKNIQIPDYLPLKLQKEFEEVANKLLHIGVMTELDEDCLARCLLSKQNYLQFTSLLNKAIRKNDIVAMDKYMTMQDKAFKQYRACANDLGLSISSRCKLVLPEMNEQPKQNKFLQKFGDE